MIDGQFNHNLGSGQPAFATEVCVRAFEPERPYPQNPSAIIYRARFKQLRAYYTRPARNTPHPNLPQVYFCNDVEFQDRTGGLIEWTRVWATIPNSWDDFDSEPYVYPGFQGTLTAVGRNPLSRIVTCKKNYDYFIVGNLATFDNNVPNYDDFSAANWIKTQCSASANAAAVPACANAAQVASKIIESNANAQHFVYAEVTSPAGGMIAGSVFLKSAERTRARVEIHNATGVLVGNVAVDLATGNLTKSNGIEAQMAAVGEGWWRVAMTAQTSDGVNSNAVLQVTLEDASGNPSYVGDGASGLYAWRGQLAFNANIPHATVPPTVSGDGTNYPIQKADLIPQKFGTRFLFSVFGADPNATQLVAEYLSDGGFGLIASVPTKTNYNTNVAADEANPNSYSIESQDSVQKLWEGSIWERERRFVKAR